MSGESRTASLSPREMYLLDNACWPLRTAFPGFGPYLVGSAVTGKKSAGQRDVDVRQIMRDDEYARMLSALGIEAVRFLGLAIGQYLASLTGLPIDFQFQQMSTANTDHADAGPRNPLGVRGMGHYVGDGEPTGAPCETCGWVGHHDPRSVACHSTEETP